MKFFHTCLLLAFVLTFSSIALAQDQKTELPTQEQKPTMSAQEVSDSKRIPRNSKVYIAPMNGYEAYLAAAFQKKEVPLVIVNEPEFADFKITGTSEKKNAGWAKTIFTGDSRSTNSASIQVVNMRTTVVAYADSSHRGSAARGDRSTAEKLAKYLKKKIEDDEKKADGKK
jgi:hypothetical protein